AARRVDRGGGPASPAAPTDNTYSMIIRVVPDRSGPLKQPVILTATNQLGETICRQKLYISEQVADNVSAIPDEHHFGPITVGESRSVPICVTSISGQCSIDSWEVEGTGTITRDQHLPHVCHVRCPAAGLRPEKAVLRLYVTVRNREHADRTTVMCRLYWVTMKAAGSDTSD